MLLISLYAIAITIGLILYWFLHTMSSESSTLHLEPAPSSTGKDPPEDNGGCPNGISAMSPYKSVRKVQLKEVYHSNETASIKVMTADGLTLLHTNESKEAKSAATKRRPVPPPPKIQPPRRPPPPPPVTPPPTQVMVVVDDMEDSKENSLTQINLKNSANVSSEQHVLLGNNAKKDGAVSASITQTASTNNTEGLINPKLPLPLLSAIEKSKTVVKCDKQMPLKDPTDVNFQSKMLDKGTLTYPKQSYSSYQSKQLEWQECCENNQTFHPTEVSMDLPVCDNNFADDKNVLNLSNQELLHYKIQPNTSDMFQSNCIKNKRHFQQESSQRFFIVPEELSPEINHISNIGSQNLAKIELCSIRMPGSEEQFSHQSSQIQQSSHERFTNECQTSSESHQKLLSVKSVPLPPCSTEDVITCESSDSCYLDNAILLNTHVDLNQNPVKVRTVNPILQIEGDLVNRINSASQTTDTDSLYCQQCKTKEEIEYEYLSKDFVYYYRDAALMNLLVPSPNHKTMINYVKGLLDIEFENPEHQSQHCVDSFLNHQNIHRIEKLPDDCNPLMCSSTANFVQLENNQKFNDKELKEKKEKLMIIICKKVDNLKSEQRNIKAEIVGNELLGKEIANKLKDFAKPNELEKYSLHIEEVEKIVNLLLSLSCRLAKAENIFKNLPVNCNTEEKKILETKRNKLKEQHDDACRLKESIDRRSNHVSTFLLKYFYDQQYLDYDRFMKMKTKLIVKNREIDEKINLGEEQLAALSVVTHFWKSTNSCI